jgi:hypothetical protein
MDSSEGLRALLDRCTARLSIPGESGTGFFVATGLILTCAHVVGNVQSDEISVTVEWGDHRGTAKIDRLYPAPYPDLALLKLENTPSTRPCVFLHEAVRTDDHLYSYGYPKLYSHGDPSTFVAEGMSGGSSRLIKFTFGEVKEGFSGAPLLNRRTGGVCGVMKLTRGENTLMGGRVVPTSVVLECFPELVALQKEFHQKDSRWYNCLSQQQHREQIDAVKFIIMKVSELKSVHNMLSEVEVALAPLGKEISWFKHTKLRRQQIDDIESESGRVWRRIEDLRRFAEQKMTYLLEEEEPLVVGNDSIISGPPWIKELLNLQMAFEEGLKVRDIRQMIEISDDLLSRCRRHLQMIDNRLLLAVNQLNRLSDQTLGELGL